MSNSRVLTRAKFRWLGGIVVIAGAVVLAALWPKFTQLRMLRAQQLAGIAESVAPTDSAQAIADYRIADILYPRGGYKYQIADLYLARDNPDAAIRILQKLPVGESGQRIAQIQFDSGQFEQAIKTLKSIGPNPTIDAVILESKAELELGKYSEAISSAKAAQDLGGGPVLLGIVYAVAGKKNELSVLIDSVEDVNDKKLLQAIAGSDTVLGQELYSRRLVKSAEQILSSHPTNAEDFVLLATIKLTASQPSRKDLLAAQDYATKGLTIDPGNLALHRLLRDADSQLGDKAGAQKQTELINQLESGQI